MLRSLDHPWVPPLCVTHWSPLFVWISDVWRHEHRERHREKYVGPANPACMFSGCNLTAGVCVCESQSCHHHFAYINRSQCQEAAGNQKTARDWQPHSRRPVLCSARVFYYFYYRFHNASIVFIHHVTEATCSFFITFLWKAKVDKNAFVSQCVLLSICYQNILRTNGSNLLKLQKVITGYISTTV